MKRLWRRKTERQMKNWAESHVFNYFANMYELILRVGTKRSLPKGIDNRWDFHNRFSAVYLITETCFAINKGIVLLRIESTGNLVHLPISASGKRAQVENKSRLYDNFEMMLVKDKIMIIKDGGGFACDDQTNKRLRRAILRR